MGLIADLSNVERVLITVVTKHQKFIPAWATETVFPKASQEPRTDCTFIDIHAVGVGPLLPYIQENFAILRGQYQLKDPAAYKSNKLHRLRITCIPIEVEDGYPVEDLAVFFEYPWVAVRLRVDKEQRWLSMFCFGRMQGVRRPRRTFYVEEKQLWLSEPQSQTPH